MALGQKDLLVEDLTKRWTVPEHLVSSVVLALRAGVKVERISGSLTTEAKKDLADVDTLNSANETEVKS